MDDWERNFAELSERRSERRRKKRLQRQVKAIVLVGIVVAVVVWLATMTSNQQPASETSTSIGHSRR
jgi:ferric-dicitrate binding protein FerR (iron transport regulator)